MNHNTRKRLLIVYHSHTGHTAALSEAVERGARRQSDLSIQRKQAQNTQISDLLACDGLLLGTPENFGSMSGILKDFFERTYYPCEGLRQGLPYALFISAGNDGTGAEREIQRIARGYGFRQITETLIVRGSLTAADIAQAETLGESMATGLSLGIF